MANYKNETIYIRIMARPDQVEETAAQIRAVLPVTAESPDYPNRITTPASAASAAI